MSQYFVAILLGSKPRSGNSGQDSCWFWPASVELKQDQESNMSGQWEELLSDRTPCSNLEVHSVSRYMMYSEEMKWREEGSMISLSKVSKEDSKG